MDLVEPFMALVIYPTTPESQARQADNLVRLASEKLRLLPGFLRGGVFLSEEGDHLVTLTEWSDRESFQQFRQSEFGRAAVSLVAEPAPEVVLAPPARRDRSPLRATEVPWTSFARISCRRSGGCDGNGGMRPRSS